MDNIIKITYKNNDGSERLDKFLSNELKISRNKVQTFISDSRVTINENIIIKLNTILVMNDLIEINMTENNFNNKYISETVLPCEDKVEIIYEDEYFIIINKKSGVLTHPTQYNEDNTILNIMKYYFDKNKIQSDPWIIHRLDKDTSGLLLIAKNLEVLNKFKELINNKSIIKKYYAIVHNVLKDKKIIIDIPIARSFQSKLRMQAINGKNSKSSQTEIELIENFKHHALLSCNLLTGRTHQIRVHLRYINHSIINDPLYGIESKVTDYKQYLHAYYLKFEHPYTKKEIEINISMPDEFKEKILELKI